MKPLRRSAIFCCALIGLIGLLYLWVDSFLCRTHFVAREPSTLRVELRRGILTITWVKLPDWHRDWYSPDAGWTRTLLSRPSSLLESLYWAPDFYSSVSTGFHIPTTGPDGLPVTRYLTQEHHSLQIPIWHILTLHIGIFWIALALRQRHQRREWQRQQATRDPQLLEPS